MVKYQKALFHGLNCAIKPPVYYEIIICFLSYRIYSQLKDLREFYFYYILKIISPYVQQWPGTL